MRDRRPRVCVVGSMVMDLVFKVGRRPRPGETMPGNEFGMFLGGKGFNQAVACRRLGADVTMVGRVGDDYFGGRFLEKLAIEGIDARCVTKDAAAGTGVACPIVDELGENSIIGVPRANMKLEPADVDAAAEEVARADVLMLQYEVPVAASRRAAEIARARGTVVVLDPAPAGNADGPFAAPVDFLVPNEIEAEMLLPVEAGSQKPDARSQNEQAREWSRVLTAVADRAVVISLGEQGAAVRDAAGFRTFPAHRVKVIDTTGAGDAFRAGLAVMVAAGAGLDEAVRFANACGALACTVLGAEPSMPRREAVEQLLSQES